MEEKDIHNDVWLEEWTPEWSRAFHIEKQRITDTMIANGHHGCVRHVGSTAIEGMPAKPIIDILVCPDKAIPLEDCIPDLEHIGYRNLGECGRAGRYFLSISNGPGKTFYLHLCYDDNSVAQDQILFQKILKESELLRARYRYTKHMLEGVFSEERHMYRMVKGFFIDGVLAGYRLGLAEMVRPDEERQ